MVKVEEDEVATSIVGLEQMVLNWNLKVHVIKTAKEAHSPVPTHIAFTSPLFQRGFSHHQSQCLPFHHSAHHESCVCKGYISHKILLVSDGAWQEQKPDSFPREVRLF